MLLSLLPLSRSLRGMAYGGSPSRISYFGCYGFVKSALDGNCELRMRNATHFLFRGTGWKFEKSGRGALVCLVLEWIWWLHEFSSHWWSGPQMVVRPHDALLLASFAGHPVPSLRYFSCHFLTSHLSSARKTFGTTVPVLMFPFTPHLLTNFGHHRVAYLHYNIFGRLIYSF